MAFAHRIFKTVNGKLVPDYDPKLSTVLGGIDLERPLAPLWTAFDALARAPVLVVRGANSDILSAATVEAMRARKPSVQAIETPDQGHAPLLDDAATVERVVEFAATCDAARRR
jgi:pimeloyl-ACP methyl ester carboxylesterase